MAFMRCVRVLDRIDIHIYRDKTIGFDLLKDEYHQAPTIVYEFKKKFQPFASIKSVRSNDFLLNVVLDDKSKLTMWSKWFRAIFNPLLVCQSFV